MLPDVDGSAARVRCPSCAGAVRPDAPWCTQCWTDLRPAAAPAPPEPVADVVPPPVEAPAVGPTTTVPGPAVEGAATWPCTTCGAANGLDRDACASCGASFLADLRVAGEPLLVLPVVGDLGALGRGQRLGLAAGVVVALLLLVALLGLL